MTKITTKTDYLELVSLQKQSLSGVIKPLIKREIYPRAKDLLTNDNRILVITGMHRMGKSTLLQQLMKNLTNYCYLNTGNLQFA